MQIMMKQIRNLGVMFSFLTLTFGVSAQTIKDTTVIDYQSVSKTVNQKITAYGAKDVLLVFDIDNTLLTSDTDLGGDFWYQWQTGELNIKPTIKQKLSSECLYGEAIAMLYELGTMSLTDTVIPSYIKDWQAKGVGVMALTSRSPQCRAATERELLRNGINLMASEPRNVDGNTLNFRSSLGRETSYSNGIFMTSGLNKGEMLAHLLGRLGRSYKCIIFVDDTRKNVDAVKGKYSQCNKVDVTLFYYTKMASERLKYNNNQIVTKEQAQKMSDDWAKLVKTLNEIFPARAVRAACAQ